MKTIISILHAFVISFLLTLISCNKPDVSSDSLSCIKTLIGKIQSENVKNPPLSVWQYDYNGQTVYYIPPYCCDMYSDLYDEHCNLICHPDGGITGMGDGKCADFFSKRKNEKLIWQDQRK